MASSITGGLQFAAALSTQADTSVAIHEVLDAALASISHPVDLAFAFVSQHDADAFGQHLPALCDRLGTDRLLACTAESVVGGDREIEDAPVIALWLAHLPGATITPMHLKFQRSTEGGAFTGWPSDLPEPWPKEAALLLLGEPFSFPADELLRRLNDDRPGIPVLGGMASGGHQPGQNRVWLGRQEHSSGAVAVLLHGAVRVSSVVSQGCRPIGRPLVITAAEQNVIRQLGGVPALQRLQEIFGELPREDQALFQRGLHVGRVFSEYQGEFRRGDFLIRNVIGVDPASGAIAIGDFVRVGQTVQFHLRDDKTADEDLRQLLADSQNRGAAPAGALLFTCNGRGTRLFSQPHHDALCVQTAFGQLPLAGFFAQGEIGPVNGQNFLHGFTASVALFEATDA